MAKRQEELRYFEKNFNEICEKYKDKCIAIKNNKIVAVGDDFFTVYKQATADGYKCPFLTWANKEAWTRRL